MNKQYRAADQSFRQDTAPKSFGPGTAPGSTLKSAAWAGVFFPKAGISMWALASVQAGWLPGTPSPIWDPAIFEPVWNNFPETCPLL